MSIWEDDVAFQGVSCIPVCCGFPGSEEFTDNERLSKEYNVDVVG